MKFTLRSIAKLALVAVVGLTLSACTRSLEGKYQGGLDLNDVKVAKNAAVGIAKFEDKRAWIAADDEKASSFIASQDPWKFGLTYEGREYAPVAEVMQDIFYKEFVGAGMRAEKLAAAVSGGQVPTGANGPLDYVLAGKITAFEFANDSGLVTVTSRRAVALSLTLVKADGRHIFADRSFDAQESENEGMGVLHTTNVDKLLNKVLKNAVKKVIQGVSDGINSGVARVDLRVIDGGQVVSYRFEGEALAALHLASR